MAKAARTLRVGTRGSRLARTQTGHVVAELRARHPGLAVEEVVVETGGDRDRTSPLESMGGVGVFVKELEERLLAGDVDVAVHSLKDLPTKQPAGLVVGAVPLRAPPGDLFVSARYVSLQACPPGTRVGTGSPRRRVQLRWASPGLEFEPLRGNLDTRLRKVREGEVDATVVAEAGLLRLGVELAVGLHVQPLPWDVMLPAPGQGALALQVRADDRFAREAVASLEDPESARAVEAERAFLEGVGGGCHVPVAAAARVRGAALSLEGMVARDERALLVRLGDRAGTGETARELGLRLAEEARGWLAPGAPNGGA